MSNEKRNQRIKRKWHNPVVDRMRLSLEDAPEERCFSLQAPEPGQSLPIYIVDQPPEGFYFPLSPEEVLNELKLLPNDHLKNLTHIWLRSFQKDHYQEGETPWSEFICGNGVHLIVLYPWPLDRRIWLGKERPASKALTLFAPYSSDLKECPEGYYLAFDEDEVWDFVAEILLYHEIGGHLHWQHTHWSQVNRLRTEDFGDRFIFERTSRRSLTYS